MSKSQHLTSNIDGWIRIKTNTKKPWPSSDNNSTEKKYFVVLPNLIVSRILEIVLLFREESHAKNH